MTQPVSTSGRPSAWGRYVALQRSAGAKPDRAFNIFCGRYKAARTFREATFDAMTPPTQRAYNALLRLGLSYAALESLCSALGRRVTHEPVESAQIADRLRDKRSAQLADVMRTDVDRPLATRLTRLLDTPDADDVMPSAAFFRHAFFHGALTASRAGAAREWERRIVEDLAASLLATADARFTEHVTAQA